MKQVTSGILMWKGWLCVPAIYNKSKYLHSRLAVSVIVRGSLLGRLAYKFTVALSYSYITVGVGYLCYYTSPKPRTSVNNKNVTEFAKRGLIHVSDFPTLTRYNFICKQAITLKFSLLLVQ